MTAFFDFDRHLRKLASSSHHHAYNANAAFFKLTQRQTPTVVARDPSHRKCLPSLTASRSLVDSETSSPMSSDTLTSIEFISCSCEFFSCSAGIA